MEFTSLQNQFEKFVESSPDKTAIEYGNHLTTYRQLDQNANRIANFFCENEKQNSNIVVLLGRSSAFVETILGILKYNGVFIPFDPNHPELRIQNLMNELDFNWVVTEAAQLPKLNRIMSGLQRSINVLVVNFGKSGMEQYKNLSLFSIDQTISGNRMRSNDIINKHAYIYFTSGSTGKPKGILGRHRSLMHFIEWEIRQFNINRDFRVSQLTTPSFDASLRDIFVPLCSGATLCIPETPDIILDPHQLGQWIHQKKISLIHMVPSLFRIMMAEIEDPDGFPNLKYILLAGEMLRGYDLKQFFKIFGSRVQLVNLYGATETTLVKTFHRVNESDVLKINVPVGKPMDKTEIMILNDDLKRCQPGSVGEIYIHTPFITSGYFNDPILSKTVFIKNPFNNNPQDIIYKTGDLGRILPDGNLECLGRIDYQVKIRGIRIEMAEIEIHLMNHEFIREAIVTAKDENEEKYLCAYITGDKQFEINELRIYLAQFLPEYMIPSFFIQLDRMPLTPNGKVDRNALPEPKNAVNETQEIVQPRDEIEKTIAKIWSEILGVERIGIHDNFFGLGGHSLKATTLLSKIHKEFQVDISLKHIFEGPTIQQLAWVVKNAQQSIYQSLKAVAKKEYYPVSSAQKRIFVLNQLEEKGIAYNMPGVLIIEGELDVQCLEAAFKGLIQRHEILRTSFQQINGEPVQYIQNEVHFAIHNLTGNGSVPLNHQTVINERIRTIIKEYIRPFDLCQAPLLRVGIIPISETINVLIYDMHHIIADRTSMEILVREFIDLYNGKKLPEIQIQYKDFCAWQNQLLRTDTIKQQEKYWLNKFSQASAELPVLNMPTDYPRPSFQSFEGDCVDIEIDDLLRDKLNQLGIRSGATLYMILLAAYNILLYKYTGHEDIIVGSPIAGRSHGDLESIIGMFVNTLAMRNHPESGKTFMEFLMEVKRNSLEAYENQDYQFETFIEKLDLQRDLSRNPLFETMFVLQNTNRVEIKMTNLKFTPYPLENTTAKFDLTLFADEYDTQIQLRFEYCSKLFKRETIERLSGHFVNILQQIAADQEVRLGDIDLLTPAESRRILVEFNDTWAEYPKDKTIQSIFEEQVEQTPDNVALVFKDRQLTYRELNEKSNSLARMLRNQGIKVETIAAIMVERSLEMVIGILGILKAGGAYLPIDPQYPAERIKYMLHDSEAKLLLMQKETQKNYLNSDIPIILLDDKDLYGGETTNLSPVNHSRNLAYIIYTSGSTGKPKGVMVEHRSVVNILTELQRKYPITQNDVYLLKTTYTFDVSVAELFGWYFGGGKLAILGPGLEKDPPEIVREIKTMGVTHINFVPTMFNAFLYNIDENQCRTLNQLKYVFVAGEALTHEIVNKFHGLVDGPRLENIYGPTESTIYATGFSPRDCKDTVNVPIGKPLANTQAYIVDHALKPLPIGIPGELCIGGVCLARGYIRNPELTIEKFVANPFQPAEKIYKTGDVAKWLPDGNIEFLGRIDNQVKIRGFRIELGEIEAKLLNHSAIQEVVVIAKEDSNGAKYLCAYFVSANEFKHVELKEFLAKELPDYMIPSYFVRLPEIPLSANGKINRRALPEPETNYRGKEYEAPRNPMEETLVNIWKQVLDIPTIGINDNFFEMKGDSIKAIQLSAHLNKYGLKIEIKDLYRNPTVKALSNYIHINRKEIQQGIVEGEVELTPIQRWFFEQNPTEPHYFNQSVMLFKKDGIEVDIVRQVFRKLVEHHDALRMIYTAVENKIIQYNRGVGEDLFNLEIVKITDGPNFSERVLEEANQLQRSIDLNHGPLVKLKIFQTPNGDHLLIVIHHLVVDGVSWRIILEDLDLGYEQISNHEAIMFPNKTDSYQEWAMKLIEYAQSDELQMEVNFWEKIERATVHSLPKDNPAGKSNLLESAAKSMILSKQNTDDLLQNVHRAYNTEINDILLTALGLALKEWAGLEKIRISLEGHGREESIKDIDITRTVGWFTSIYPVLLDITNTENLSYVIKTTKENLRNIPNKGIGYGIIKYRKTDPARESWDYGSKPDILFNYLGQFQDPKTGRFHLSDLPTGQNISPVSGRRYSLEISGQIFQGSLMVTFNYWRNEYQDDTISNLVELYQRNLQKIIAHCLEKQKAEVTPSDLGYNKLSLKQLEELQAEIGELM